MAIQTCTITGNVKNLLNSNVSDCTVKASTLAPFFHGTTWISGEVESVVTNASGDFSIGVIETETVGKKLSFTFEYYDGVANKKRKTYSVVVPNSSTAVLADLVTADAAVAGITTFPAGNVTVAPIVGLTATDAQAAISELLTDITTLSASALTNVLPSGDILVGNGSNVATAVAVSGDISLSNAGVAAIASGVIVNADVSASAAIARSKLAAGGASVVPVNDGSGVLTDSTTTATQLGYLDATSSIQTQLNAKQATGNYVTALTGDVAASGPGSAAATIGTNVVTNAKAAQMAANTIKGNNTGGTANAADLTVSQVKTLLNLTGTNSGDVTLVAVGAVPNANGASLSTQALTLQPADNTNPGVLTAIAQPIGGVKTFSSAPVLSSLTASLPLQLDGSKSVTAAAITLSGSQVTGALGISNGGTGQTAKTAAFDALSPLTTSGDIIYGGASGTGTRLPKGADGTVLTLGSGLPSWVAPTASSTYTIASKTANYTVTSGDYLMFGDSSGGAFTFTLPTAVGISGKVYYFYKTDTSTNLITIDGAGTETINGDITIAMGTKGDRVGIISDGANWKIVEFGIYVAAQYYASANLAVLINAVFKFNTKLLDTHAAYATGTGLFTVPLGCSGFYRIACTALATGAAAGLYLVNNGSAGAYLNAANVSNVGGGSQTVYLTSGQTLAIASDAGTTLVGSSAPYKTCFSIERLN